MSKEVLQRAYDQACAGVLQQGKPSLKREDEDYPICLYRSPDGAKCAVGFLLTDEQMERYQPEGNMVPKDFPSSLLAEMLPGVREEEAQDFLSILQETHDDAAFDRKREFVESFKERAIRMAETWELKPIEGT